MHRDICIIFFAIFLVGLIAIDLSINKFKIKKTIVFNFFYLLSLANYDLSFTITINDFSDGDDNKIKLKKKKMMQFRIGVH